MQEHKTIKYTTVLPEPYVEELKQMAANRQISSVNQGIRLAVGRFIEDEKRTNYARAMREAALDPDYMARTAQVQEDFAALDAEEMGSW